MSFIRVILSGTMATSEVWSVGPAYNESTDTVTWDQEAGQAAADAIVARAVPLELRQLLSTAARLTKARIERRTDAGILIGAAEAPFTTPPTGTDAPTKPPQTSVVISLRTTVPGSRGRGRLYWPALSGAMTTGTVRLTNPAPAAVASAASVYLDGIETDLKNSLHPVPSLIDLHLCVVSPTTNTRTDITRIQVGDVLDTQRRRRDKLAEAYADTVYPPA